MTGENDETRKKTKEKNANFIRKDSYEWSGLQRQKRSRIKLLKAVHMKKSKRERLMGRTSDLLRAGWVGGRRSTIGRERLYAFGGMTAFNFANSSRSAGNCDFTRSFFSAHFSTIAKIDF